jgi:hypothetical protein
MRFDNRASFRCHGNLDKVLTPTGDQAVVSGDWNLLQQHVLIWAATPLGEDIDPKRGCILYNYILKKATISNINVLKMELRANLQHNFPEYTISNVSAIPTYDETTGTNGLACSAMFGDIELGFVATAEGLLEVQQAMKKTLGNLVNITKVMG